MSLEVFVEGEGLKDVEVLELPAGASARKIVELVAAKSAFPADEALLFREDEDEPLDLSALLDEAALKGRVHHVHRLRAIKVTVFYGGRQVERAFPPSARIGRVLEWAVSPRGFKIDPAIAPEMELALHGQTEALPKKAHIGRFVRPPHEKLELDLIRGVIPNGAA